MTTNYRTTRPSVKDGKDLDSRDSDLCRIALGSNMPHILRAGNDTSPKRKRRPQSGGLHLVKGSHVDLVAWLRAANRSQSARACWCGSKHRTSKPGSGWSAST